MTTRNYDPATLGQDRTAAPEAVFSEEQRNVALEIVAKYPNRRSAVLPLLFLVQSIEGYVSEGGMREVASILGLTPAEVLATGSFYTMLKKKPQGEYLVSVCRNISCTHRGSRKVIEAVVDHLGIELDETTDDGLFTIEAAECLATCDGAPSMQISYEDFYDVTPGGVIELIESLRTGDEVRSVRGETIKTSREISYEIATAGLRVPGTAGDHSARTIGGESPRSDTKPTFRPKEPGDVDG